jgi:hypothetical protein
MTRRANHFQRMPTSTAQSLLLAGAPQRVILCLALQYFRGCSPFSSGWTASWWTGLAIRQFDA